MSLPSSLRIAWNGVVEAETFPRRNISGEDDVLDFLIRHFVDVGIDNVNQRRNRPLAFSTPPFADDA